MTGNSMIRGLSVIIVMLVFGLVWYAIALSRLKKRGIAEADARKKASEQGRLVALLAAFVYMLSMVSIIRLVTG